MGKIWLRDIWRTLKKEKKRLLSIAALMALGITLLTALRAAGIDLRYSADRFYDTQGLYDVYVVSTLGLTEEDVEALGGLPGIKKAEGIVSARVHIEEGGARKSAEVRTLCGQGINVPLVRSGRLPVKAGEIAVTESYLERSGKKLGDTLLFSGQEKDAAFPAGPYTIVGAADDRSVLSDGTDEVFLAAASATASGSYTAVYLTLSGAKELLCYSGEYEAKVQRAVREIETELKEKREQARYDQITGAAYGEIDSAEAEIQQNFAEADARLDQKWQELVEGRNGLEDAEQALEQQAGQTETQYAQARQQIANMMTQVAQAKTELEALEAELTTSEQALAEAKGALENKKADLSDRRTELAAKKASAASGNAQAAAEIPALEERMAALEQAVKTTEDALAVTEAELTAGRTELAERRVQIEAAETELAANLEEVNSQEAAAKAQIETARTELSARREEYENSQTEYFAERQEHEDKKEAAEQEIEDARAGVAATRAASWYVQGRELVDDYVNIDSNASFFMVIGMVFPVVLFVIMLFTAMVSTRSMIEKDREELGLYLSMGYRKRELFGRYLAVLAAACIAGAAAGLFGGFLLVPKLIFGRAGYSLPSYVFRFDWIGGVGGPVLFAAGILGAAAGAFFGALRKAPAELLGPGAPEAGGRVAPERIPFLWKLLSPLNKNMVRNLLRDKGRLLLTVFGIAGCSAVIVCGLALRDAAARVVPGQYGEICRYDLIVRSSEEDHEQLLSYFDGDALGVRIDSMKLIYGGKTEEVELMAVPDEADMEPYIHLEDTDGKRLSLGEDEVFLTQSAARALGIGRGDTVTLQDTALNRTDAAVARIVKNYLGNMVYMNQSTYRKLFGNYAANSALAPVSGNVTQKARELLEKDGVISVVTAEELGNKSNGAFLLMDPVITVILVMAAGAAFLLLRALESAGAGRLERERALLKALGLSDREICFYAGKEILALTLVGGLAGLPLGTALSCFMAWILKIPSVHLAVRTESYSCGLAVLVMLLLGLAVSGTAGRRITRMSSIRLQNGRT